MLKETLVKRFGEGSRDMIEAEVQSRLSGRLKLEVEDVDAIERSVLQNRRISRKTASVPDLTKVQSFSALDPAPPASRTMPQPPRPSSGLSRLSQASGIRDRREHRVQAPYGASICVDDGSERSRVQVVPKYFVPLRAKTKPTDHWDLIVLFDAAKHREEDRAFREAGKAAEETKVKARLDGQMEEIRLIREQEQANRRKERQDMLAQVEENRRIHAAEQQALENKRDKMKQCNDEMMDGLMARRQRQKEKREREQQITSDWLASEAERKREERIATDREYARKCAQARQDLEDAEHERERKRQAQMAQEKADCAAAQQGMDNKEAANRAAVKARMDQIERNCKTIGAGIADRDAKAEAALQAKIKRVQEESDRLAKEDADRRRDEHNRKVREMMKSLDQQMHQREMDMELEREDGKKQAEVFRQQLDEGNRVEQAKQEARRKAREELDKHLIGQIRASVSVHPMDFGASLTKQQELAYNRGLFEHMASERFCVGLTGTFLQQATHKKGGKLDPFPSVGRYEQPIDPMELQVPL